MKCKPFQNGPGEVIGNAGMVVMIGAGVLGQPPLAWRAASRASCVDRSFALKPIQDLIRSLARAGCLRRNSVRDLHDLVSYHPKN